MTTEYDGKHKWRNLEHINGGLLLQKSDCTGGQDHAIENAPEASRFGGVF